MYTPSKRYFSHITCTREKDDTRLWQWSILWMIPTINTAHRDHHLQASSNLSTIIGWSGYKYHFCCNKHVFVATKVLSRQAYFCHDKRPVLTRQTRVCRDKSKLVATKLLPWQNYVCCNKHTSIATKDVFCHDNQAFVPTKTCLSRPKWYSWQLPPMIFHRHHRTTVHDDDCQEAHVRVCVTSRCPITQCWTKIKVTAWAAAAFRRANNCAWSAGVPSLNAGLKTRCHCLGNCCMQAGKCQCVTYH